MKMTKDEALLHIANEWADTAVSGLQWLKNIRDGISTPEVAIANIEASIQHCRNNATAMQQIALVQPEVPAWFLVSHAEELKLFEDKQLADSYAGYLVNLYNYEIPSAVIVTPLYKNAQPAGSTQVEPDLEVPAITSRNTMVTHRAKLVKIAKIKGMPVKIYQRADCSGFPFEFKLKITGSQYSMDKSLRETNGWCLDSTSHASIAGAKRAATEAAMWFLTHPPGWNIGAYSTVVRKQARRLRTG